jgi:hypothetical protein
MFLGIPDPDPLLTSTDPDPDYRSFPFSHENVEQTKIMVAKQNFIQQFSCLKFIFNHQTYFYNLETYKFHLLKH